MAYTAVNTKVLGDSAPASDWNTFVRDNWTAYASHDHGSSNDGGQSLGVSGGLVKVRFTDASAPAAPGAGKTQVYSVSGKTHQRAGAGGSDEELSVVGHAHVFAVDVEASVRTNETGTTLSLAASSAARTDADVLSTKTDTYGSDVEVACTAFIVMTVNEGSINKTRMQLLFDGSLLASSVYFNTIGVDYVELITGTATVSTGGSKIVRSEWDITTGTPGQILASHGVTGISFDRT